MREKKEEREVPKAYRSSAEIALAIHERLESSGASDMFCLISGVTHELASGQMGVREANGVFNGIGKFIKLAEVQQRYGQPGRKDDQALKLLMPPAPQEERSTEDARDAEIAELRARLSQLERPMKGASA